MTYSTGTPVKAVAGRLALDFINTADWTEDNALLKERITSAADLRVWQAAIGLPDARWDGTLEQLHDFRQSIRMVIQGRSNSGVFIALDAEEGTETAMLPWVRSRSLRDLVSISAVSILADHREHDRVKLCPGHDCGWLFLDETKNSRRRWCLMEVCGNRAKSSRHYARKVSE